MMDMFDELESYGEDDDNVRSGYRHAPTKYCGNKHNSLHEIHPRLPYLDVFVDVFGGSGQVLFTRKKSKLEVYNDRHSGMSAFYRVLQNEKQFEEFRQRIELLQHSRELFTAFREEYATDESLVDRAVKWYYIVQVSFGGKGKEFGRVKKGASDLYNRIIAYLPDFDHFHERLKGVQIENLDWKDCIKDYDSHTTVFYLDPPYWESNQYDHSMTKGDHMRMCDMIFESKGYFALSGYENTIYDNYPWDDVHAFDCQTTFLPSEHNVRGLKRSDTKREFLWIKEAI